MLRWLGERRGCNVDGLFEVRTLEWIRFIEDRQRAQSTVREMPFNGHFPAGYVTFDKHLIEIRLASGTNFGGTQKGPAPRRRREKFLAVISAHDPLAGRKRKRFQNAGIWNAEERRFGRRVDWKMSKPRYAQPGVTKNFAHAQFAPASLDGSGMVEVKPEPPRGVSRRNGRPVSEGKYSPDVLAAKRLHHPVPGRFRSVEMQRDRLIAPR